MTYRDEGRTATLPELGTPDWELQFDGSTLRELRRAVSFDAELAGLDAACVPEFAVAVNEIAANSVKHGGGAGTLRFWAMPYDIVCEIEDAGVLGSSALGMLPPDPDDPTGRGLWRARQFSHSLSIVTRPGGTVIRMRISTR